MPKDRLLIPIRHKGAELFIGYMNVVYCSYDCRMKATCGSMTIDGEPRISCPAYKRSWLIWLLLQPIQWLRGGYNDSVSE